MVIDPQDYRWSSYHVNAMGESSPLVTPHAEYLALAADPICRRLAYRALFDELLDEDQLAEIRAYVQQQRVLGSSRFQERIEAMLGRCTRTRPAHRPVKVDGSTKGL